MTTFDADDYQRRLIALESRDDISLGEEAALLGQGLLSGNAFGPLNARKAILDAKRVALRQARHDMLKAIRQADAEARANAVIPLDVQQIVTGAGDDLIKVG